MTKYLFLLMFSSQLFADPTVEKFQFEDHDYLKFECKTVLHDPNCHKCRFQRYVIYDPWDLQYQIIERQDVSPFRN